MPSFLHREHTFYCDTETITYLFECGGYTCTNSEKFKSHSIFYKFEKCGHTIPKLPYRPQIVEEFKNYFQEREINIKSAFTSESVSIFPAGHYGQLVYYYLADIGVNIKGFYDNDKSKQGGRVYGTDAIVKSPLELANIQIPELIILCASVYNEEIKQGLLKINPSLTIYTIH